jgi:uncharacterized membrane protein
MPWYFFAFLTPTFYSFSNFLDKFLIEKRIKEPIAITAIASIVSGILGLFIGIVTGFTYIGLSQTCLILFAGLLLTFYLIPYFAAMQIEDASTVVPLFQFIPVITLILSTIILKETLTFKQIIGLILVVVAGVSLASDKLEGKIFKPRKSLWFMLLASLMYGFIGILFRFVVRESNFWTTLSYEYIGSSIGGFLLLLIPKVRKYIIADFKQIKTSTGLISLNNGFSIIAQMSESYAYSLAAVPLVDLIGSVQPFITLIEGIFLTRKFPHLIQEDISHNVLKRKSISILLIFSGMYLVYA